MPLPVIASVYRVALLWTHSSGQHAVNVMHLEAAGSTARAVATALDAHVTQAMWNNVVATAQVFELHTTPLDGTTATDVLAVTGAKWTGSAGASDHVPAVAAMVSLRSLARGPSHRGRLYLPFQSEANMANGSLASVTAAQSAWNTFLTAMNVASVLPVIASYRYGTASAVTSFLLEPVLATQRRRQTRLR